MRLKLLLSLSLLSSSVYSFPENSRKGYVSCGSCHVSPTGGGVLTRYGKALSESMISTLSYEQQSSPVWIGEEPSFLSLGGDVRHVNLTRENARGRTSTEFLMQADAELALFLSPQITLVGSTGVYGLNSRNGYRKTEESRRYYALLSPEPEISLRFGKFFPGFGLMLPDHTRSVRRTLFPQGSESFNAEIAYWHKDFELLLTGSSTRTVRSVSGRAVYYLGDLSTLGVSLYCAEELTAHIHGKLSPNKFLYLLFEFGHSLNVQNSGVATGYLEAGWEVYRGIIPRIQLDFFSEEGVIRYKAGGGPKLYPIPHFELDLFAEYQFSSEAQSQKPQNGTFWFIGHYYL